MNLGLSENLVFLGAIANDLGVSYCAISRAVFLRCFLALSLVSEFAHVVLLDLKLNDTRATAISK
mgnify:CR=1 FL=1